LYALAVPNDSKKLLQPFQLVLESTDLDALARESAALANQLRAEGFLMNVRPMFELTKPELRVEINRDRAGALGVSVEDISRTLQIMFGGLDLSKIKLEKLVVKADDAAVDEALANLALIRRDSNPSAWLLKK
jgi:multidrug efflux pump subunit AcrB